MKSIKKGIGFSHRKLARLEGYLLVRFEGLGKYIERIITQKRIGS